MGFREDHPRAVRVHARLWLALIAAVVVLAAAGGVSLAATDSDERVCEASAQQAHVAGEGVACEDDAGDAVVLAGGEQPEQAPPVGPPPPEATPEPDSGAEPVEPAEPAAPVGPQAPGEPAAPAVPADPAEPAAPVAQSPESAAPAQPVAATVTDEPAVTPSVVVTVPGAATTKGDSVARRRAARRRPESAKLPQRGARERREPAQVYFPPVSVDWLSMTPLAPPAFGSGEATRFAGPLFLLPIYQAAAVQYRIPWEVLAAINEIETNYGANTGVSSAGAIGWMQFMPATWQAFGVDANRDGRRNPHDPVDAIFAAARYLRASGAQRDLPRAIFAYNHANWYVEQVLRRAEEIGDLPEDLLATLVAEGRADAGAIRRAGGSPGLFDPDHGPQTIGHVLLLDDERLRRHVLADDRIEIYGCGRTDVREAVIDRRVLETLAFLARRKLSTAVTSLRCGHGYYTSAGSVSEHSYGAAVDIARVNGTSILGNQGEGSVTDELIRALLELRGGLRPHQIISLMSFSGASNTLALGDHDDHVHVGFAPLRNLGESR